MPGLVARVIVDVGQEVKSGEVVAVLNVMKTEVDVYAPADGKIKEILVAEWDEMDTGTLMIKLD
jgi:biotin carboxyl carrier protein